MRQITYFFRHQIIGYYSIELLFTSIASSIPGSKIVYVPFVSSGLYSVLRNIFFARKRQGCINHITGDIHYVILGFKNRYYNILTIHDSSPLTKYARTNPKYWVFQRLWYKWPVRKAHIVTTVSDKSRKEILMYTGCDPGKVVTIPNFVDPRYTYHEKQFNSVCPSILQIGCTKNKNLKRVIEALVGINCELRIIGNVPEDERDTLRRSNIKHRIVYALSSEEIRQAYIESDLVMYVSTYEGFGLPILEAQATGRVVITSDISPCREVAGANAICVDPLNVEEIRNAVVATIEDETLRSRIIKAGIMNVKEYTFEKVQEQYLVLYDRLLSTEKSN